MQFTVSVPSRGIGVIDLNYQEQHTALSDAFPSPLGEMGLSIDLETTVKGVKSLQFPSPLGEMGLSIFQR